jgi:ParB/RepB/Spo0J family partition protein
MNEYCDLPIDQIKVTDRKRKISSDIYGLADSIRELGLINPISVTTDHTLIAGNHRLEACKLLGWTTIPVRVKDQNAILTELAEIDENLIRYELTALEEADHFKRRKEIYEILHPESISSKEGGTFFGNRFTLANAENALAIPSFAEDTANKTRKSKRTIYNSLQIAENLDPSVKDAFYNTDFEDEKTLLLKLSHENAETQKQLAEKLVSGKAKGLQDAKRLVSADKIKEIEPVKGKYKIIYADPPWEYGGSMNETYGTADKHYPTMPLENICALPVDDMAEDNAVLFLWATSPQLPEAFQVIEAWGFIYKASFVWDKIKHVMGHYNSVRHELLLVATKGSCTPENMKLFDSVVSEERTEHSAKPETFRNIIDTIYPSGNRIELFARDVHEKWERWGNQV